MGQAKAEMMRQEELEPFYEWLENNYDEGEVGEEGTETWEKAFQIFEHYEQFSPFYDWVEENYEEEVGKKGSESWEKAFEAFELYCEEEIEWYYLHSRSPKEIFDTQMSSVTELLKYKESTSETQFSLLVMLHGHTVAAVESYLASTFIHKVINSDDLIKKLVETDPVFSKMKFTLREIFEKQKNLNHTVAKYLKDLIFHDLKKVKPMFKNVLGCDFGDIKWLYKAVATRHHCVHRAGLNKDGDRIDISVVSIKELVDNSTLLIQEIEDRVEKEPDLNNSKFGNLFNE